MELPDEANRILIKWGQADYLRQLVEGNLYLNTPEYYRLHPSQGIGDKRESCAYSYRALRDDFSPPILKAAGEPIPGITRATVRTATKEDHYLLCWSMIPAWKDSEELSAIKADLRTQRSEFGASFVALRERDIPLLADRIEEADGARPLFGPVCYSPDPNKWGCSCKSPEFTYQREYRFLVGMCDEKDVTPKRLKVRDISDLLLSNGRLDLRSGAQAVLHITKSGVE